MAAKKKEEATALVGRDLVLQEIENTRLELESKLSRKVHSFCFQVGKDDYAKLFIKEPDFSIKKLALDISLRSIMDAAQLILESSIIKEESDERIYAEDAEERYPDLRLGAIMDAQSIVSYLQDISKKK
jgi:hypothetical protein